MVGVMAGGKGNLAGGGPVGVGGREVGEEWAVWKDNEDDVDPVTEGEKLDVYGERRAVALVRVGGVMMK